MCRAFFVCEGFGEVGLTSISGAEAPFSWQSFMARLKPCALINQTDAAGICLAMGFSSANADRIY